MSNGSSPSFALLALLVVRPPPPPVRLHVRHERMLAFYKQKMNANTVALSPSTGGWGSETIFFIFLYRYSCCRRAHCSTIITGMRRVPGDMSVKENRGFLCSGRQQKRNFSVDVNTAHQRVLCTVH